MWFKVDDGWWRHRKTRRLVRSHPEMRRDAAAVGLWTLAGDWCADNGTDGWIPEDELEQWADDWSDLAKRIVAVGYWSAEQVDGESGYRFHDWEIYQPQASAVAAKRAANAARQAKWRENHRNADGRYE